MDNISISSLLWYLGVLFLSVFFAGKAEQSNGRTNRLFYFTVSYIIVTAFCACRFFVGNDYYSYYTGFQLVQQYGENIKLWEPGFYLLNKIFIQSDIGYLYVMGLSSVISMAFLYNAIWREGNLKYGVFCLISLGLLIYINNAVRQGLAVSICVWGVGFLKEKSYLKFTISVILASTFHFSAIVFIAALFVKNINLSPRVWYFVLITVIILQISGFASESYMVIMSKIPYYGDIYTIKDSYSTDQRIGLSIIFNYCLAIPFIWKSKIINDKLYVNLYLIGLMISGLFFGFYNFERIALYFYAIQILVYPKFLKKSSMSSIIILIVVMYFSVQSLFGLEKHGAVPYRTFFRENIYNPPYDKESIEQW